MTAPAQVAPNRPAKSKHDHGSVKETLESILVAFILAFIFRAFVVEAFVIPTGSMAPTLLGAHMRFRCKDCGYRFDHNYGARSTPEGELIIGSVSHVEYYKLNCPNCGFRVKQDDPQDPENDSHFPSVYYGDRILVVKYLYLFNDPQRWDVVVFKSPAEDFIGKDPTYTQNFIKRLTGKPGESVMILDGDIYVGTAGEKLETYTIQTKPRYAQSALWRVIYDNDFHPRGLERDLDGRKWRQPWTVREGGNGWDLKKGIDGRAFHFDNAQGSSTIFFDRTANTVPDDHTQGNQPFTDWLAYDMNAPQVTVHDLKTSFFYDRKSGDGPLRVMMSDGRQKFAAVLTPTEVKLVRVNGEGEQQLAPPAKLPAMGKPIHVEMVNVDYEVRLYVNDEEVARTTPAQYSPDMPTLLEAYRTRSRQPSPGVEITAADQASQITHLSLWRDIYYGNGPGLAHGTPDNPINLGPKEYFVLGDNSPLSGDARMWTHEIYLPHDGLVVESGRVPARFMLGRAFFVYWPAGFRPAPFTPALAPNFGDMRFIR